MASKGGGKKGKRIARTAYWARYKANNTRDKNKTRRIVNYLRARYKKAGENGVDHVKALLKGMERCRVLGRVMGELKELDLPYST
jgi:hypothetical protein